MAAPESQETRTSVLENCHDFTIRGGTFNVSTTVKQSQGDFRLVRFGDLNLLDEIDKQNVVVRRPIHRKGGRSNLVVVGTRKIYRARVFGAQEPMTVIVGDSPGFQRRKAEAEEHRIHRHPNLAQLFGFTYSGSLNALLYHDEMMTISHVEEMHARSALASFYMQYEMRRHYLAARRYCQDMSGTFFWDLPATPWIRVSTGTLQLCLALEDEEELCEDIGDRLALYTYGRHKLPSFNLAEYDLDRKLSCGLELDDFYEMLVSAFLRSAVRNSCRQFPSSTITLPSICIPRVNLADYQLIEIGTSAASTPFMPNDLKVQPWQPNWPFLKSPVDVQLGSNRWTRVEYSGSPDHLYLYMNVELNERVQKWWFSQQNHVHMHLQSAIPTENGCMPLDFITRLGLCCHVKSNFDGFTLQGTFMADSSQHAVYLFLLHPQVEFVDGRLTVTIHPEAEKYYWAFDPTGLERLTDQAVDDIGLPAVEFSVNIYGLKWDDCINKMIREFHAAKGFDRDSQDAAIAMGYPLVDIKYIKKVTPEMTGEIVTDCEVEEVDDGIYYSLGLC